MLGSGVVCPGKQSRMKTSQLSWAGFSRFSSPLSGLSVSGSHTNHQAAGFPLIGELMSSFLALRCPGQCISTCSLLSAVIYLPRGAVIPSHFHAGLGAMSPLSSDPSAKTVLWPKHRRGPCNNGHLTSQSCVSTSLAIKTRVPLGSALGW